MSDPEHSSVLRSGVEEWNRWRRENPSLQPDLRQAELQGRDLAGADLHGMDLSDAALMGADLSRADLHNSTLQRVKINDARAWYADFRNAQMQGAYLWGSDFREADLSKADLSGADLRNTQLVMTKFAGATLHRCKVYGICRMGHRSLGSGSIRSDHQCSQSIRYNHGRQVGDRAVYLLAPDESAGPGRSRHGDVEGGLDPGALYC